MPYITKEDFKFLLSLAPDWVNDPNNGHDPTMYGTGTYEGDIKVHNRMVEIKNQILGKEKI
jgi:hypothetical protein